ncbi:MAG: M20 family metallopeptidase [Legionella sp.]
MLNYEILYEYIVNFWQAEIIPSLSDYITIPNKSPQFDQKWNEHGYMDKAVNHLASWCRLHSLDGMMIDVLRLPGRTPLLLVDIPGSVNDTVLIYGHLDKQPEMDGWHEGLGPWMPVLRDGRLYGRGSADDGYAIYAALAAIKGLQKQHAKHARCLILIEACEESGSYDLPFYIDQLKERIGTPSLVVCLDSGAGNYEQIWVTTSLRGLVNGCLTVEMISEGIHSGNASGIVADSFRVARQLLSRIEDERTGEIILPELHCSIPQQRYDEACICAQVLSEQVYQSFPLLEQVQPMDLSAQSLILNRTWRPALTIIGAEGLPELANAGNVLRPKTTLKLSMRLPPGINAQVAAVAMRRALTEKPPYHAKIYFDIEDTANGWQAPPSSPWLHAAIEEASQIFYKKNAVYMGEGGSIPFMAMLGERFPQANFMITGVLGPHSNAHGPNEFLHIDMVQKLTASVAYVLYKHAAQQSIDNR